MSEIDDDEMAALEQKAFFWAQGGTDGYQRSESI